MPLRDWLPLYRKDASGRLSERPLPLPSASAPHGLAPFLRRAETGDAREGGTWFCSKPFTSFEVSRGAEEGEVFLCCPAWLSKPVGNLARRSVEEIWNGPAAVEIRRSILDGSFSYCNRARCPHLQTFSDPVTRATDVTDPLMRRALDEHLTVLPWGPIHVNASFDRSCNLSCPSCREQIIMETENRERILGIRDKLSDQALKGAKSLYITGSGDPFGSPFFRHWLQTMKRADMPVLETIHLHTNGLLWTPRMWSSIPADIRALIREADISIDAATHDTYAINRRGGDFNRLLDNLQFIASELRPSGPLEWLGINMVVQQNNVEEMADFVRIGQRLRLDTVYFHQLVNWGTFTDAEFLERAIHFPKHPHHARLRRVLRDPIFDDPIVNLGNISDVRAIR